LDEARGRTSAGVTHCLHGALDAIDKLHGEARRAFREDLTQPSVTDGMRLVPAGMEIEMLTKMADFKTHPNKLTAEFMADYPRLKAEAPIAFNGLYEAKVWKAENEIAEKFHWDVVLLPCPTDGKWSDWLLASVRTAQVEFQERLEKALKHCAERCLA